MKKRVACYDCSNMYRASVGEPFTGELSPENATIPLDCFIEFDVTDNNVYDLKCRRGHRSYFIYPDEKFELLFESGLNAFYDGYFREAVSSIAASIERLHEFALKVMCYSQQVSREIFDEAWKSVSAQSERQLGAFTFLWVALFKEMPHAISNNKINFRNKVIHGGQFPTDEVTLNYIRDCLTHTHTVVKVLKSKIASSLETVYKQESQSLMSEYSKTGIFTQSWVTSSIVNRVLLDHNLDTLDTMLDNIKKSRESLVTLQN